jgi:GNAT superfamily N-acetyltransferase
MYTIDTDKSRLDIDLIHRYLCGESYWAADIPREILERSIANSLCFAAFDENSQVGFARVITDYAVFAYIGDVFVASSHRGRGVGKLLMTAIREHSSLQTVRRWSLVTRDAHELYRQFGFRNLEKPERHMEIVVQNPYGP